MSPDGLFFGSIMLFPETFRHVFSSNEYLIRKRGRVSWSSIFRRLRSFNCWILLLNLGCFIGDCGLSLLSGTSLCRANPSEGRKPRQMGIDIPRSEDFSRDQNLTFMMCMLDSPNSLMKFFLMKKSSSCLATYAVSSKLEHLKFNLKECPAEWPPHDKGTARPRNNRCTSRLLFPTMAVGF